MTEESQTFSTEALRKGLRRYAERPECTLMQKPLMHDAAYEYTRATASAYAKCIGEMDEIGYVDVDLFYYLTVDVCHETKLSKMRDSNLPEKAKAKLEEEYAKIYGRWERHEYENKAQSGNIGFFHRAFGSFRRGDRGLDKDDAPRLVRLIVDVYRASGEEEALDCVKFAMEGGMRGVGSGTLSQVLHLLQPEYFPILNAHEGRDSIFYALGVVKKKSDLSYVSRYAKSCQMINAWRDENYPEIRNYRIFDLVSKNLPRIHVKGASEPVDPLEGISIEDRYEAARELLEAEDPFGEISRLSRRMNLFDVLRITRTEIRHSNVIAWLLTPDESHGLGTNFLRAFLGCINKPEAARAPEEKLRTFEVYRERRHIDLLLVSKSLKWAIAVENKTFTGEHDDQLSRYADSVEEMYGEYRKDYVYLTPNADMSSNPGKWVSMGYDSIVSSIDLALGEHENDLSDEVRMFLDQYKETIRRDIMGEDELAEICRGFYREHKLALDVLYNYRADDVSDTCDRIKGWLESRTKEDEGLRLAANSKGLVRFGFAKLDAICGRCQDGAGKFKDGSICNFGFSVSEGATYLYFTYPDSDAMTEKQKEVRRQILAATSEVSPESKTWVPRIGWETATSELLECDDEEFGSELAGAISAARVYCAKLEGLNGCS